MNSNMMTRETFDREASAFQTIADRSRVGLAVANVRASFVAMIAIEDGIEDEQVTTDEQGNEERQTVTVHLTENAAWKAFGLTRSVGQRNLKPARVMLALGYALDALPTVDPARKTVDPEAKGMAALSMHANRQGLGKVTDEQWQDLMEAIRDGIVTTVTDADGHLSALVEDEQEERKEEQAAARKEREEEKEHAASPAGHLSALTSLVAYFETASQIPGAITEADVQMLQMLGHRLAMIEASPAVEETETESAAA